jgi:ceramide glucosyltransferase
MASLEGLEEKISPKTSCDCRPCCHQHFTGPSEFRHQIARRSRFVSLVPFAVGLTTVSLALYVAMMTVFVCAMRRRRPERTTALKHAPRVSILKPLAGRDDELEANLEAFARLDYPSFEILLGVASISDPAYAVACRFLSRHPKLGARVVVTDPDAAINPKVAQLVGLERVATGDVFVISDSNVRVRPDYLWSLVAELGDERVGMVTSLFAGTGERTIGAALENLQLCASSAPGYVAMNAVASRPLTVGKSMAVRRRDLTRLGGFSPVGDVLAEDHALGRRFLDAGFLIRTSLDTVENRNVACTVMRTIERHTRWSKMRRALLPPAFAVEPMLTPIILASIGILLAPGKWTAGAFVLACLLQTAGAMIAVRVLRGDWFAWWYVPLELVRSYLTFFCWLRACGSRRIEWRGHGFVLARGSLIVRAPGTPERSSSRARLAA